MKRAILLTLLLASVTFAAFPNLQFATRFQNSALDWSGNGRNGTVYGSGVYTTARGQQALYFDGTGDYVTTPSFGLSGTVVVFACRARIAHHTSIFQTLLSDGAQSNTVGFLFCYRPPNSNDLVWQYSDGTSYKLVTAPSFFASPYNDVWLHAVVACDYTGKICRIYRNGVLFYSAGLAGAPRFPSATRVKYIGAYDPMIHLPQSGYLADVQLWTLPTMPPLAVMNASVARIAAGGMPCW